MAGDHLQAVDTTFQKQLLQKYPFVSISSPGVLLFTSIDRELLGCEFGVQNSGSP